MNPSRLAQDLPSDLPGKPDSPSRSRDERVLGRACTLRSYLGFSRVGNSSNSPSHHSSGWILTAVADRTVVHGKEHSREIGSVL